MKTSRQSRRYFEATLQTGREAFNRVVCFSPEKRDEFVHAADNGQAVKLVGTRKSISYSNPGGFDVLVEVIEVRVVQAIENKVVQVQGIPVELKTFEVCDATGQTGLTVWDRLILSVELGKCYTFHGEERSMVLTNSAVFGFVRERFLSVSAHDGPALEEMVIAMPEIEVTISAEGLVVRFAEATVQGGQGNVLEAEQPSTSYARETGALLQDESLADLFQED
ncbi:unnamed protein product [Merluccius merluccius]